MRSRYGFVDPNAPGIHGLARHYRRELRWTLASSIMYFEGANMAEMETQASPPETSNKGVQLGFGTLIIIALIVTMCSGRSEMGKIQKDTAALKQQLGVIDKKLDTLVPKSGETTSTSVEEPAE
jgi:hypothetical protein